MIILKNCLKHTEQDDFEKGCLPDTEILASVDIALVAESREAAIDKVIQFFDATTDDVFVDGDQISVSIMENRYSNRASEYEIERWKEGKEKLYCSTYTLHAYKQEPCNLEEGEEE